MYVSVHLSSRDQVTPVIVRQQTGAAFISVRFGDVSILLSGFDGECAAQARAIAAALTKAADECTPAPVPEEAVL